jgi:SOS response regulatory protein OraA/RecX
MARTKKTLEDYRREALALRKVLRERESELEMFQKLNKELRELDEIKRNLQACREARLVSDRRASEAAQTIGRLENEKLELVKQRDQAHTKIADARIELAENINMLQRARVVLADCIRELPN